MQLNTIILALCVAFFVIAVHQTIVLGLEYSYGIFMFVGGGFLLYLYRKEKLKEAEKKAETKKVKKRKK